jgi:hypothetical protein
MDAATGRASRTAALNRDASGPVVHPQHGRPVESSRGGMTVKDLDLSGVFTRTYLWSLLLMAIIAVGGLMLAAAISPK